MSRAHFKGSSYAFAKWMQDCAEEISRGERKGVTVIYPKPHPKTAIGWFRRRLLRGEFKKRRA
jgi:hypothetical protein